jgi:hypothetical protein
MCLENFKALVSGAIPAQIRLERIKNRTIPLLETSV